MKFSSRSRCSLTNHIHLLQYLLADLKKLMAKYQLGENYILSRQSLDYTISKLNPKP